jgi:hypothetical protein
VKISTHTSIIEEEEDFCGICGIVMDPENLGEVEFHPEIGGPARICFECN